MRLKETVSRGEIIKRFRLPVAPHFVSRGTCCSFLFHVKQLLGECVVGRLEDKH